MKRWIVIVMVVALMLGSMTGCASKKPEDSTPAATNTPQTQSGDSRLDNLMKTAAQANQMSFDMVMTMSDAGAAINTTGKMYVSDKKVRMEMEAMGMKMITITNAQGESYLYNPAEKTAMKMNVPQDSADLPNAWVKENSDTSGMKIVGEEKKDGFDCLVVTTTQEGETAKMWLRKDIGMPVRVEQNTSQGTVVVEYKNYQIGAQPDSLFEIPAGTAVKTMPVMPDVKTGN